MDLRKALFAAPLVLAACGSDSNEWDKVWDYTCRVQEWASNALASPDQIVVWNQVFTTAPDTRSHFEGHSVNHRLPNHFNQTWGLEVYFITNQSLLDNWDKSDLDQIANQINTIWGDITVLLEWYADARWSESANERMSTRRIESVENYIRSQLNSNVQVRFEHASFGENVANQDTTDLMALRSDRRVVVTISWNTITAWLDRSPADAYVLDASGSMVWDSWQTVSGYNYLDGSTIYTFTDAQSRFNDDDCADSLDLQTVDGQTPLLISIMDILQTWEYDNKTITILSDWRDNVGGLNSAEVINEAKVRGTTINVIWIWEADTNLLRLIAEETNGIYTFER